MNELDLCLTFLGTGTSTGVPMIGCECAVCRSTDLRDQRLRSSVLVRKGGTTLLVDTTPDMRTQLLRAQVSEIHGVCITHFHKDHLAGFDDLRALVFKSKSAIPVHANASTLAAIRRDYAYACFNPPPRTYAGLSVHLHERENGSIFKIGSIQVRAVSVWHGNLSILGFVFDERLVYLTDVKTLDLTVQTTLIHKKVLVLNALRRHTHPAHLDLSSALELATRLHAQKTYLTHASHLLGKAADVEKELPKNIFLAYDNLHVPNI